MESSHNAVETTNAQCRAALSAQRRVPVEIWQMIFSTLCLSLHEYSFDLNSDFRLNSPLLGLPAILISQVCSHWKIIATGMPSIWSAINFHLSESLHDVNVSTLKVYLSNSETSLLKMRFTSSHLAYLCPRILQAWETLSRHIHRSKEFVMGIGSSQDNYQLPPIPDLTFPYLEFYRGVRLSHDKLPWPWFRRALREAPRLTTVDISPPSVRHCDFPFSQLTAWRAAHIPSASSLNQFFEIARACIRLKNLALELHCHSVYVPPRELREVEWPSLQRLSLSSYGYHTSWAYSVLASLVIPSLEECNIQCEDWPGSSFLDMVRSSSSLKRMRLTVFQTFTSSPCLLDVLQAASELTHFKFSMGEANDNDSPTSLTGMTNDMISTLLDRLQNDPNTFLPNLNLLSLQLAHGTLNTQLVERVLEVVSARQFTLHPLKEFRLRVVRPAVGKKVGGEFVIGPELLERIRVLNEGQIKVAFEDCFEER